MEGERKIWHALLIKALGYSANDVVEEYLLDANSELVLTKKKVMKKHYTPDVPAVKLLLEKYFKTYK